MRITRIEHRNFTTILVLHEDIDLLSVLTLFRGCCVAFVCEPGSWRYDALIHHFPEATCS